MPLSYENINYTVDFKQQINPGGFKNIGNAYENYGSTEFGAATSNNTAKTKFNRFKNAEGLDYFTSNITYVFFTKPQMNVSNPGYINDSFIQSMQTSSDAGNQLILKSLDGIASTDGCFNYLLSNSVESFDLKDNIIKTTEVGETIFGNKIITADNCMESYNNDTFTVQYTEYSDMAITKMHKIWLDYMHLVKHNQAAPYMSKKTDCTPLVSKFGNLYYSYTQNASSGQKDFIMSRELDYVCSVYYFRTAEDGQSLKYWAKYTGVFPLNVPFSAMSFNQGDNKLKQLSVNYTYSFKEDMNPEILAEFNILCSKGLNWKKYITETDRKDVSIKNNWKQNVCITDDNKIIFL